ncbi:MULTISPECIES: DUF2142 domain-containing protein [Actinotignum]|uniref:DUF2142 domain-containing protein n=1 Tax=Actinotignum timonense TaxID=1870995 RepID=A0AAW9HC46_9ACTO|nr:MULTISPECIES: DUF2142 domain-containing protein [Actinotignum]MBS5748515.1 DUF2142 domain-containing protein [Actinotignum schaalii]MDE1537027.1 DUF2142 domain-containing protein [Actinotignum schaalii]MDE1558274.1 DUF2142 domain-containing protein [Actinotignum schaalii]MDE1663770.1 DUF2142 domain-containing protein [Actinotignum schaalii]MDK6372783.1 DUF2142 domain-containing protein [Actinotignum timonense]
MRTSDTTMSSRRFYTCAGLLTVLFLIWQMLWALASPPLRTPDEPHHLNSVIRLEQTGQWPDPGTSWLYRDIFEASRASGLLVEGAPSYSLHYRTRLGRDAWIGADTDSYRSQKLLPHEQRRSARAESTVPILDQMTQHPPLYYAGGALVLRATGMTDAPWDRQILILRLYSIVLTSPLVPCLIFAARRTGLSRRGALLASGTVYAIPMLSFISASVTNDALFIGAGALTIAAVSAAMFGSGQWRTVFAAGLALGLGLWSKGTFIPMGLVVFLAFLANPRIGGWGRRLAQGLSAGLIGVLTGGYWWLRNIVRYGVIQPDGFQAQATEPGTDIGFFAERVTTSFVDSFWSDFGWLDITFAPLLLILLSLLTVLFLARALGTHPDKRWRLLLFTANIVLVLGMLIVQAYNQYRGLGIIGGVQGRYLFAGALGLLVVIAMGAAGHHWDPPLTAPASRPRYREEAGWRSFLLPAVVAASMLLSAYAMLLWLRSCYPGAFFGMNLERWALAAGLPVPVLGAALALGYAALLGAGLVCYRLTRAELLPQFRPAELAYRPAGSSHPAAAAVQ